MRRPVLVKPPEILPVSIDEAKRYSIVEADEDESVLAAMLEAATGMLDGWNGVLGRCLVEQEWRQEFACAQSRIPLALLPVIDVISVTDSTGAVVDPASYSLMTDAGGYSGVDFAVGVSAGAVSVVYRAGYPTEPEVPAQGGNPAVPMRSTVPASIKAAICMLASQWFNNREATVTGAIATVLPLAVDALITPYKVRRL